MLDYGLFNMIPFTKIFRSSYFELSFKLLNKYKDISKFVPVTKVENFGLVRLYWYLTTDVSKGSTYIQYKHTYIEISTVLVLDITSEHVTNARFWARLSYKEIKLFCYELSSTSDCMARGHSTLQWRQMKCCWERAPAKDLLINLGICSNNLILCNA